MKNLLHAVVCILALGLATVSLAQPPGDDDKDPIDKKIEQMLEKNPSTAGTVEAYDEGIKLWDAALNKAYGELMKALPAADREALRQSQRAWLASRDAGKTLDEHVYKHAQGTMYTPAPSGALMELIKARTLHLRACLEAVQSGDESH